MARELSQNSRVFHVPVTLPKSTVLEFATKKDKCVSQGYIAHPDLLMLNLLTYIPLLEITIPLWAEITTDLQRR